MKLFAFDERVETIATAPIYRPGPRLIETAEIFAVANHPDPADVAHAPGTDDVFAVVWTRGS